MIALQAAPAMASMYTPRCPQDSEQVIAEVRRIDASFLHVEQDRADRRPAAAVLHEDTRRGTVEGEPLLSEIWVPPPTSDVDLEPIRRDWQPILVGPGRKTGSQPEKFWVECLWTD